MEDRKNKSLRLWSLFLSCYHPLIGALSILPLLMIGAPQAIADDEIYVTGNIHLGDRTPGNWQRFWYGDPPLPPVRDPMPIEEIFPIWDTPFQIGDPNALGAWGYANAEGRVRARVRTGGFESREGQAMLYWDANYIRDNGENPTFTISPSKLTVLGNSGRGPNNRPPYAEMRIGISICNQDQIKGLVYPAPHYSCQSIFWHNSKLEGIVGDRSHPLRITEQYGSDRTAPTIFQSLDHIIPTHPDLGDPFADIKPRKLYQEICVPLPGDEVVCFNPQIGMEFAIPELTREIRLGDWGIEIGDEYLVQYFLDVRAGEDFNEQFAEALLGDPLDVDVGGITLNTTHTQVASNAQYCGHTPDLARFAFHGDATVTDTHSGLMWQRCPAGHTLDENNTPADLSDDLCIPGSDVLLDWQDALLEANSDNLAGYTDWLVPNAKQLESLTELSCTAPAIDTRIFPDTPPVAFWTSTPAAEGSQAWTVEFSNGDIRPSSKDQTHLVRLVRQSGASPVQPNPAVIAGDTTAYEGDSGTTTMTFTIVLSQPSSTDVSMDYQVLPLSATENDDYVATAGSITVPAGAQYETIALTVNGDTSQEYNERVRLLLSNISGNAYLAKASGLGVIIDDEPRVTVLPASPQQAEGDTGTQGREFVLSLDKPAAGIITLDYATADGSATAGQDYSAAGGSVLFNVGETTASIFVDIIGDTQHENDEDFSLILSNLAGASFTHDPALIAVIGDDDGPAAGYRLLNDTAVVACASDGVLGTCPQGGFPGQDADLGLDATQNDDSDGTAGFSFTKLDASGIPIGNQEAFYYFDYYPFPINAAYAIWDCVQDEVTGLTWEVKTDVAGDLRKFDWTYSWYNSDGVNDGGEAGTANGGICVDNINCDTEKYVAAVNAANLCGFNDWRLPRLDELNTLAAYGSRSFINEGMDKGYFPHNYSDSFWSATPSAINPGLAWELNYQAYDSGMRQVEKSSAINVRLVRGGM